MKLPNGDRAVVSMDKLRGYCLNTLHDDGKHKARVFASALNLTEDDAEELQVALLAAVRNDEATEKGENSFGQRYEIKFTITRQNKTAPILSGWIVRNGEDFPRLTSCYVDI